MEPKISVTTVAYNSARFLEEAILSVRNQSFSDFEFIIINDCSTDNSWEIITRHAAQDNRIIAINNETNLGSLASGNKALFHARGKYIAVFDSDDVCFPDRLKVQYEYFQSHPDIALIGTGAELINEDGQIIGYKHPPTDVNDIKYFLLLRNPIIHPSVMLRKSVLDVVGNYNPDYLHAEDYKLYESLISAHYRIANLSQILIKYRRSPQSLSISPKTRAISLASARRVSFDNVQRYTRLSQEDVNIAVDTINRLSTGLKNVLKTIRINRDLTEAFIKKEKLNPISIQSVWTIYRADREFIWKYYFKTCFSWPYKIAKRIKYFLKLIIFKNKLLL